MAGSNRQVTDMNFRTSQENCKLQVGFSVSWVDSPSLKGPGSGKPMSRAQWGQKVADHFSI